MVPFTFGLWLSAVQPNKGHFSAHESFVIIFVAWYMITINDHLAIGWLPMQHRLEWVRMTI
ncbi:MAG TPA: hypothetical protein DCZ03_13245 [Gammaproteobacteria bacterium]|nr:hypothetical protein [Gammaproteobacteria bacterium]